MYFLLLLFSLLGSFFSCYATSPMSIDGFLGTPPAKVFWIIKKLNEVISSGSNQVLKNRLILHGPPGNGKGLLVQKIAWLTNRVLIPLNAPSIVNKFQGSGAERIAQFFEDVVAGVEEYKDNALIFIDEIDAIACDNEVAGRNDYKAALQQLWLEMDKYKDDHRIFIICATNHFNKLDTTFLDRFGNNIIELQNPDAVTRKLVIVHYLKQYNITLEESVLNMMVVQTKGLSIRSLEDMANDIYIEAEVSNNAIVTEAIILKTLKSIRKKFDDNNIDTNWKKKLERANLYVGIVGGSLLAIVNSIQLSGIMHGYYKHLFGVAIS